MTTTQVETYSDAARRLSDAVNLHVAVGGNTGRWLAARLSDGGTDGTLYDTRRDAIEHQLHESLCCYVKIPVDGMPPRAAEAFLRIHRQAYDAGLRFTDPDDPRSVISPIVIGRTPVTRPGMPA